jgi:hypothetical protein
LQFSSTGFATLKYTNQSEDCYKIYLEDKEIKELGAHESHEERVSAGHLYRLKAVQSTGVSGSVRVFETSIAIEFGTKEFAFPL